jgi:hypothetical protein
MAARCVSGTDAEWCMEKIHQINTAMASAVLELVGPTVGVSAARIINGYCCYPKETATKLYTNSYSSVPVAGGELLVTTTAYCQYSGDPRGYLIELWHSCPEPCRPDSAPCRPGGQWLGWPGINQQSDRISCLIASMSTSRETLWELLTSGTDLVATLESAPAEAHRGPPSGGAEYRPHIQAVAMKHIGHLYGKTNGNNARSRPRGSQ